MITREGIRWGRNAQEVKEERKKKRILGEGGRGGSEGGDGCGRGARRNRRMGGKRKH